MLQADGDARWRDVWGQRGWLVIALSSVHLTHADELPDLDAAACVAAGISSAQGIRPILPVLALAVGVGEELPFFGAPKTMANSFANETGMRGASGESDRRIWGCHDSWA